MRLPVPPILVITDRKICPEPLETRAAALFQGGCRWLSLREKDLTTEARLRLLQRLRAIGAEFGAVVGIHDDIAAAASCGCALHLPSGADAEKTRRFLGETILLGQSCHNATEIEQAAANGVDYVTLSPIFESAGKPGYGPPLGRINLSVATKGSKISILALGGITLETAPLLDGTGIGGIAVMGEAMSAKDAQSWFSQKRKVWEAIQ